jgi:site-specific recombinase XerD
MPVRYHLLELYRVYLEVEQGRQRSTWREYARTLLAFWAYIGKEPLAPPTLRDLEKFTRRPGLAEQTRANYTSHIKGFYSWAVYNGHLASDPFARVKVPKVRQGSARDLSVEEVAKFLRHVTTQPRTWAMAWVAYGTGVRVMEVAGLRIEDCRLSAVHPHIWVRGKGGRPRVIPLNAVVRAVLVMWLEGRATTGPVFEPEGRPGEHLKPKYVSAVLCDALKAAGVRATAHQLRHTFATLIAVSDGDLWALQELLGHGSIQTTQRYTRGATPQTRRAVEALPDPRGVS